MAIKDPDRDFISVNKILGKQASIAFIPASQIIPWFAIIIFSYTITNGITSLGMTWFFAISFWLITSWWLLTGDKPNQFIDSLKKPPGREWCDGNAIYISPIPSLRNFRQKTDEIKDSQVRVRLKPIIVPKQSGGVNKFMPFQNELDLIGIVEIEKDGRKASGFLLTSQDGSRFQIIFGFKNQGLHDQLFRNEIVESASSIEEGMKDLMVGERLTFHLSCKSNDLHRQQELTKIADDCKLKPIAVLVRNEQVRLKNLTHRGKRQTWNAIAFCTYTADNTGEQNSRDLIGKFIDWAKDLRDKLAGTEKYHQEQFYIKLLRQAFDEGFVAWELLLNTKIGLDCTPMDSKQLWEWLWERFNNEVAPPIPQIIKMTETETGFDIKEEKTTDKHPVTVLIKGSKGNSACPEHRQCNSRVYLTGIDKVCGVMTMEEAPSGWVNTREQIKWMWKILSNSYVHDTEAWVELTTTNNFIINDNLARQAKQSKAANTRAIVKGQGRDVGAEIKQEESFDAQRRLYKGTKALNCAVVFLVYRNTVEQLERACNTLSQGFGNAKVIRERNIAWEIWLQTLPITMKGLLNSGFAVSERRLTLDTETVAGVLPLTIPRDIDSIGIEFISEKGGKPLFIDLFENQISRALITGESGSGKSILIARFAIAALARNIPVVGMDISAGGSSTFKTLIELLGDEGAYYDISSHNSNLMEPPDLRNFDKAEKERRLDTWKEFVRNALVAIAMGKINQPHLAQRVDSIVLRMLEMFLRDPEIIERYNAGFEKGWKSTEWQQMPTLHDLLRFCSRERLNLKSFEDIDRIAINQINSQAQALLATRVGKSLSKPSSFSPEPAIKFFALSGLSNEQDSYLMALNAQMACIRNALSHPRSLFIGDELSVLLKKSGFASSIGELCATGRKEGISVVLSSQDLDAICQCSAGAQIMQNMVYRITGRITNAGVIAAQKYLSYDPNIISKNATEAFLPKSSDLYSCWLLEKGGRFWQTRFYPGEMTLGALANNQNEKEARDRVMSQYPKTLKGKLMGLKHFSNEYCQAIREGFGFEHIGQKINDTTLDSAPKITTGTNNPPSLVS